MNDILRLLAVVWSFVLLGITPVNAADDIRLNDDVLAKFLESGKWDKTAAPRTDREALDRDFVIRIIRDYRSAPADRQKIGELGLIVLATSIAEWGVVPDPGIPDPAHEVDPAKLPWSGVVWSLGKHLMSYVVGGVGVIHADVGILGKFMQYLVDNHPDLAPDRQSIVQMAVDLSTGRKKYADVRDSTTFQAWMENGLHQEDAQRWLIEYWLNHTWMESFSAVMSARQTGVNALHEVFVNARIRNSSVALANCAILHAKSDEDELAIYVSPNPCGGNPANKRRLGEMRRPRVLFDNAP